jgi:hypothetical protein
MNPAFLAKIAARFDSNETIFFSRELETIDPTEYMTLFAGLRARTLIPLAENVDPLDLTYTYRMWEVTGRATIGAPNANDAGIIGVKATEASTPIKKIPVSYSWGVDEIKQAAKKGVSLDRMTVQAAMSEVARAVDHILAFGVPGTQITGLLNNTDVDTTSTPVTKTGGGTPWSAASLPGEWLADLNLIVNDTRKALKQASLAPGGAGTPAFDRFVLGLPSHHYGLVASTPRATTSDTTVLKYALLNNPWIESIEEWWKLDAADVEDHGTIGNDDGDPMIICYPRNPMCIGGVIPREFESLPPQEEGDNIVVYANGKCGGTVIRYPVAVRYLLDV